MFELSRSVGRLLALAAVLGLAAVSAVSLSAWHVDPVPEPPALPSADPAPAILPPPKPAPESDLVPEYELTTRPVPLEIPHPRYTEVARRARVEGRVILEVMIDERGRVFKTRVLKGLPMGLDQMAIEAVRSIRFKPGTLNGKPVKTYHDMVVDFSLKR